MFVALSGLTHKLALGQIVFEQVFLRFLLKNVGNCLRFVLVLLIDGCSGLVDLLQKLNLPQVHQLTDCIDPWMESVLLTPLLLHFLSRFLFLLVKRLLPLFAPLDERGNQKHFVPIGHFLRVFTICSIVFATLRLRVTLCAVELA